MNRRLAPSIVVCRASLSAILLAAGACFRSSGAPAPSPTPAPATRPAAAEPAPAPNNASNRTAAATQAGETAKAAIAAERTVDASAIPDRTVGVPPLAIAATDTAIVPLAYGLAELLSTDLARSGRLTVVDRMRLDAVLRELKLASSGQVDSGTAPRVGHLLGARRLIVGAVSQVPGNELSISAQVADVTTGVVTTAVTAHAPLARILDAETELALRILGALGITLTAAERSAIEAHPTRSVAALLAYSRGVRDEAFGRYGPAAQQFQSALAADPNFANARAHLSGLQGRATSGADAAAPSKRAASTPVSGNAAMVAAAGVNPSLVDLTGGGAAGAVSAGATNSTGPAHRAVTATLLILIRPVP